MSQDGSTLKSGQLGTADVTASTVANIGPGIDFYFAFGVIAVTAGVAAPLTILAAGVAVVLLAFTVAEFTKAEPSAGSFITYVETSLGPRAGVATALLVAVGYTVAIAGVFTMSGGMVALTLAHYTSWHPPWEPLTLVLTVGAIWLTVRGVRLSTTAVGVAVLVQVVIMVLVCVIVLVDQRAHLSGMPFSWAHLTGGLAGLSAGFPLALYMFIGWENGPALAEECRNPRRTVPRALYISVAIGTALFVFFAYATVTGFNYNVSSIGRSSVPFLTLADHYLGGAAILAWVAGTVSVLATLVAGANSQARMLFDGGRSGLLPARLGHVRPPRRDAGQCVAPDGWRWTRDHRGLVGIPPHRRGHRIDEPRRPLCRVLNDGHDRDPVRLLPDDARPPVLHVAPPSGLIFRSSGTS
jgi:amino acid transporter